MTPPLERREGWEGRLAAVLEDARGRSYVLGEHDCFRLACAAVEALTGVDLWAAWAGRYRTRREALALLASYGGTFTGAFSRLFGAAPEPIALARRGDIAEYQDPRGERHLGVVNGARVVLLLAAGVEGIPRSACRHAWRIG
jgi:hypothetical protein